MTFAYIGSFVALLLFMPMVNYFKQGHSEQYGWMMGVVIIAVMCAALFYGCFAWTRERVKPIREKQSPLKEDLKDLLHNKPWWILLGAGIAALIFNSIRDGATVYYFKYFVVEEEYSVISFFGVSFVLSGIYLAVGQAANNRSDPCGSGQQSYREKGYLYGGNDDCNCAEYYLLLV